MEALLRIERRPPCGDVGQLDPDQGRALLALLLPDVRRVEVDRLRGAGALDLAR